MKFHSLAIGAVVLSGALTTSLAQTTNAPKRVHVETLGAANQSTTTHFNVYFPLTHQDALEKLLSDQTTPGTARYHQWLTPAQFKTQFGPNASDVAKVKAQLQSAGFTILSEKTQSLEVQGSDQQLCQNNK